MNPPRQIVLNSRGKDVHHILGQVVDAVDALPAVGSVPGQACAHGASTVALVPVPSNNDAANDGETNDAEASISAHANTNSNSYNSTSTSPGISPTSKEDMAACPSSIPSLARMYVRAKRRGNCRLPKCPRVTSVIDAVFDVHNMMDELKEQFRGRDGFLDRITRRGLRNCLLECMHVKYAPNMSSLKPSQTQSTAPQAHQHHQFRQAGATGAMPACDMEDDSDDERAQASARQLVMNSDAQTHVAK